MPLGHIRLTSNRRKTSVTVAALVTAALALTSCGSDNDDLAQRAANDGTNYVAGDGSVEEFAPENRGEPVDFESETFDGATVTGATFRDQVTVLNFWYAACAPCRVEARDLQAIHEEFIEDGVEFYGVNTRDTQPTAEAFERTFGITYPSMEDRTGQVMMAMTDYAHPSAVPTTLVLDNEGRVSARVVGIVEPGTLRSLITTVIDEDESASDSTEERGPG